MEEIPVVTVFLREGADVLLLARSEDVGSYAGRWGAVAGHAEGDPDAQALVEIEEETGLAPAEVTHVRTGEPFPVEDAERGTRWLVTPFLFEAAHREVETNYETAVSEWAPPTEILRRETVPDLWTSYWRIAPTVETVRADADHGSAYLSVRALEVLRDAAALAAERGVGDWSDLEKTARGLLDARPSMAAVQNRVNRVLSVAAAERTPETLERAAGDAIAAAFAADAETAERAADLLAGGRVVTLSRSGTVLDALRSADPASVTVAESRPGAEGVGVAERLAEAGVDVTLTTDANLPGAVDAADLVAVGADTVLPDGAVVNKVGTRAAALAAADAGVPTYAVCASDKVAATESVPIESGSPPPLYEGDADVREANPAFERVPARLVDGVVTEAGTLSTGQIEAVASVHAARARWRAGDGAEE